MPKFISLFLSAVFSPLIILVYGMVMALSTTVLVYMPMQVKLSVIIMTGIFTFLLPVVAIWLMHRMGYVSGFALVNREERFVPFVITLSGYAGCWLYLVRSGAPSWLTMFVAGAIVAALLACVITRWWKISIHTTSLSGLLAMSINIASSSYTVCDMMPLISFMAITLGLVATARLALKRHTLSQVSAGSICGFVSVYVMMTFA